MHDLFTNYNTANDSHTKQALCSILPEFGVSKKLVRLKNVVELKVK